MGSSPPSSSFLPLAAWRPGGLAGRAYNGAFFILLLLLDVVGDGVDVVVDSPDAFVAAAAAVAVNMHSIARPRCGTRFFSCSPVGGRWANVSVCTAECIICPSQLTRYQVLSVHTCKTECNITTKRRPLRAYHLQKIV